MAPPLLVVLVLWGASLFGGANAHTTHHHHHHRILAPNMSSCQRPAFGVPAAISIHLDCCLLNHGIPANDHARLFRPKHHLLPDKRRVRRPAHLADEAYARRLARAYTLMRALPRDDPRSFMQQANIHCAYCDAVYKQMGSSTQYFQVHGSWLFFPFHRWYLYFHERILAKLLEYDDEGDGYLAREPFTLTFWNYDHPNGSSVPWLFRQLQELYDPRRNQAHELATSVVALDCNPDTDLRPPHVQLQENANVMYRSMIRDANSLDKFFGRPYALDDSAPAGPGTIEGGPHSGVHEWLGDRHQVSDIDMGSFYAAARDPIFYAHHGEIDRFWEIWKSFHGNRNLHDKRLLNTEFYFYNEDAELVRVKAGDALHTTPLGYEYEDVEITWRDAMPVRLSHGLASLSNNDTLCKLGEPIVRPCSVELDRDPTRTLDGTGFTDRQVAEEAEYLVLGRVSWQVNTKTYFDIYVNLPSADQWTSSGCVEYVDFYASFPQNNIGVYTEPSLQFDITDRIRDLGLENESRIVVTIVPKLGSSEGLPSPTSVSSFSIQYLPPY